MDINWMFVKGTERCGKIKMMENQVLKLDVESKGRE
jgi:hypothetical protein